MIQDRVSHEIVLFGVSGAIGKLILFRSDQIFTDSAYKFNVSNWHFFLSSSLESCGRIVGRCRVV